MNRAFTVVFALVLVIGIPAPLFAKGETVEIIIKGADLTTPIEITDPKILRDFNVWAGPGVRVNGKEQTEGFIIDWSQGVAAERPNGLLHYEVSVYAKLQEARLVYVVFYDYNPSSEQGYIYLPGKGDKWSQLNMGTIYHGHGFEGNWFRATSTWQNVARRLIARARR